MQELENTLACPRTQPDDQESATPFGFALHHIGINCLTPERGMETARVLCALFGLSRREMPGISTFADPYVECLHKKGRGEMGHICFSTTDVDGAMEYLAGKGVEFLEETKKFDADGRCTFAYMKGELSGFAFHLQKAN